LSFEATLNFDGGCRPNPGRGAGAWLLVDDRDIEMEEDSAIVPSRWLDTTSNQAEYYGLITGLQAAIEWGDKRLKVLGDSKLVIMHVKDEWECNSPNLTKFYQRASSLAESFDMIEFDHVPRELNTEADQLAKEKLREYL
jgi:ribonuclease HI